MSGYSHNRSKDIERVKYNIKAGVKYGRSMDFIHNALTHGKAIRLFKVFGDFNLEALTVEVDFSLLTQRVIYSLNQLIACLEASPIKSSVIMTLNISVIT